MSEAELARMIEEVDVAGDGKISFDEFCATMQGTAKPPPAAAAAEPAVAAAVASKG